MNNLNIKLALILAIPVLLVTGMLFFCYRLYSDLQTLKRNDEALATFLNSTSTPAVLESRQEHQQIYQDTLTALCVVSNNAALCSRLGISPQAAGTPAK